MQIAVDVARTGLKPEDIRRDSSAFAAAVSAAIEETTARTKERGRAILRFAFRSSRVPTILRGDFFPAKGDKPPAGYVYSAWFKRGHDILAAFATGATLRAPDGGRLLVPADQAPGAKLKARVALELLGSAPRIALIRTAAGKLLLVERAAKQTTILGFLVRQVRMPKRAAGVAELPAFGERVLLERLDANLQQQGF